MSEVNVPEILLSSIAGTKRQAAITPTEPGIWAGSAFLREYAEAIGLRILHLEKDGSPFRPGERLCVVSGTPMQLVMGEDRLLGAVSKPSGIATAAFRAVRAVPGLRIVSGGWKKMPLSMKDMIRCALHAAGAMQRISDGPFVYLDKNYVRLFGGIAPSVRHAAALFPEREITVQIRGEYADIEKEAMEGLDAGARVLMIDTGDRRDLIRVHSHLRQIGRREEIALAFAGGVALDDLPGLRDSGADIVDLSRAVLDAGLIDFKYDILPAE